MKKLNFIDLFAGLGGLRIGFEEACFKNGIIGKCILTSEIKKSAIKSLNHNFNENNIICDVTTIKANDIPDFDVLLGGFPCQAFSKAGNQLGFDDTRGTLFFEIAKILKIKKPKGFILENVDALVTHDKGKTFKIIINTLKELGYFVSWEVLNSKDFGVPQKRKRIFIVGSLIHPLKLTFKPVLSKVFKNIMENTKIMSNSIFSKKLLNKFSELDCYGKLIIDKRGGKNNIHSWNFELYGNVNEIQKTILNSLLLERRKKEYSNELNLIWRDGIPLLDFQINRFMGFNVNSELDDLVKKGYLNLKYPTYKLNGKNIDLKTYGLGYSIRIGRLSFEFNSIVNPDGYTQTITATDIHKIGVIENKSIRSLTDREGLRLFGYPETYNFPNTLTKSEKFDLLGNTVVVPIVNQLSDLLIKNISP